jgi:ribonuclease HI
MELLAVLEVLELGPDNNLIILTDSAYVMLGMKRHSRGTRSLVRQCDRSLWMRATAALARRKALGFFCTFVKCSSHDKDPDQEALVSLWNNRADKAAESARINGPPASLWWTTGDMGHVLLHHGCTVRGDPRCHIRMN